MIFVRLSHNDYVRPDVITQCQIGKDTDDQWIVWWTLEGGDMISSDLFLSREDADQYRISVFFAIEQYKQEEG